ncbi:unnamed protein product [Microthlaspi erraticum]|uniref:Reverse transcriptase domain-containing protein n=1 Tax=Microthlaspi erraticum TaxID=1685480 RepID=A0A6D2JBL9_9BRAS|nr:unnamed protein product [Microthlaspi erraticum]
MNDNRPKRSFKFDKRWIGKDGLKEAIKTGWGTKVSTESAQLFTRIANCRDSISQWRKNNPTNSAKMIEAVKTQLERAQTDDNIPNEEVFELKWQLCSALREEELFWKQKSRANWLREGDKNTKFFYVTTKQRRVRNKIIKLKDGDGSWVENEDKIEQVASAYFQNLFTSSNPSNYEEALKYIAPKVTQEINTELTTIPSDMEIKEAIFSINSDKAPGPDGMTSLFYQRFWKTTSTDITKAVRDFFETGVFDERLNQTNICLIPKNERPREMSEYRPISLCNVCYKIISKILCARLRKFLPRLISETQSAFVARRLITDNVLVAQEMFHALRTNMSCKKQFMAVKTDMSKAYDRVEWKFLETLMLKLGFSEKWVSWIMWSISSVSYKVLINGDAKGHVIPSRGLRQGDPLSPFLFIICTEALISLLRGAEDEGRITGLKIARGSPAVSHLLFADDSLFFCKTDILQCAELMKILDIYGKASGQLLNCTKSSIFFGSKVPQEVKANVKTALRITKEGGMGTYLGIPEQLSGSKNQVFAYIQERLHNKVNSWSAKLLSKGGKEVQIKAVAQALPTYVMSCFLLPLGIIKKIRSAIARFWWSSKIESKGLHWIAWEKICISKDEGGLGFRDMQNFNLALLAKQLWRLLRYPSSLLARVLKGRYFRYTSPLETAKANAPSYGWRSIIAAKDLLQKGLRRSIKSGFDTKVWTDPWLPTIPARPALDNGNGRNPHLYVNHLIDFNTKEWKMDTIKELIHPTDIPLITSLRPSRVFDCDGYVWSHSTSGQYTVRSGYALAMELKAQQTTQAVLEPSITTMKRQIWKVKTTGKLKHFMWQVVSGFVASCSKLVERHCGTDRSCPRCGADEETINHIFFECPPAIQTWALSPVPTSPGEFPCNSIYKNFDYLLWRVKEMGANEEQIESFPWIIWFIWKARNEKAFNGEKVSALDTAQWALSETECWKMAQVVQSTLDSDEDTEPTAEAKRGNRWPICNTDASWDKNAKCAGLSFVLRNEDGSCLYGAKACANTQSATHAELEAIIWALKNATEIGYTDLYLQTDCQQVLKMIKEEEEWPAFSAKIEDILRLKLSFTCFDISFVSRNLNVRADSLAKGARSRGFCFDYVNSLSQNELPLEVCPIAITS